MLRCKEAAVLASKQKDTGLSRREQWQLRIHLWMCSKCTRYTQQIDFLQRISAKMDSIPDKGFEKLKLSKSARQRIRKHLFPSD